MPNPYPEFSITSSRRQKGGSPFRGRLFMVILLMVLFSLNPIAVLAGSFHRPILHHNLSIQILPDSHSLSAQDTVILNASDWSTLKAPLRLSLNGHLTVESVQSGTEPLHFVIVDSSGGPKEGQKSIQIIEISNWKPISSSAPISLAIHYKGKIHDPPRASKDLRFVRPDKTLGHIGPEGIYLSSETAWYPDVPETLSTFSVEVTLPQKWMAVTQGTQVSLSSDATAMTETWEVNIASESLTLVANQFVKHRRDWQGIEMATYLFPEDSHLSEQYLDATAKYLEVYTKLLGPYPFQKFAVVENFFPSGLGLPSFTLLGNRVIKRGYTQPYSLGHEIVHSWIGNSVLNEFSKGNWVEGLTTYLANYYYEELQGLSDAPLKNRQRMVYEFNLYAPPSKEYPLKKFHHKETRLDNAIGYQKAAMVFHMLRVEIGDEAFFSGIRTLIKERTGAYADWGTLKHVFEKAAGRELGWYFTQWVERSGAPSIRILKADVHHNQQFGGKPKIELSLEQSNPPYQLSLPITIELAKGDIHETSIMIEAQKAHLTIPLPAQPKYLEIDSQFNVFRRLERDQIPPMLNIWVTEPNPIIILPDKTFRNEKSIYRPILSRLESRELTVHFSPDEEEMASSHHSQLILDDPENNRLTGMVIKSCPMDFTLGPKGISIRGQTFAGPQVAWLISCPHPTHPGYTFTVFSGFSDSAVSRVARLLFFYGWDSYLVFKDGKVVSRGTIDIINKDLAISLPAA